eukprot:3102575-Amphidinium_carterae.2
MPSLRSPSLVRDRCKRGEASRPEGTSTPKVFLSGASHVSGSTEPKNQTKIRAGRTRRPHPQTLTRCRGASQTTSPEARRAGHQASHPNGIDATTKVSRTRFFFDRCIQQGWSTEPNVYGTDDGEDSKVTSSTQS